MHGNHIQNFIESQFLVLKDEIAHRIKSSNIVELVEVVTTDLETHYRDKLLSLADQEKMIFEVKPSSDTVKKDPSHESYTADITAGWFSCPKGSDGSPCKHQFAAIKKYRLIS